MTGEFKTDSCDGLKIAMVVHRFPVLSETFVLNQAAAMLDRGHDVRLFAFERGEPAESQEAVTQYRLMERLTVLRRTPDAVAERVRNGFALASSLSGRPDALMNALNVFRHKQHAASLRLLYTTADLGGLANFDIVHCQFGSLWHTGLLLARASSPQAGVVVSFRGRDISKQLHDHGPRLYDQLFAEGNAFLPNCEYFRDRLVSIGCPSEHITVVRSGLDVERFPLAATQPKPGEPVRLLTVGRLVEKKGIVYAIKAVATLLREGHNLEYTIIGDGPLRGEFKELIAAEGAGHAISLAGRMDHRGIVEELASHHVFLAPSVKASDGDEDAPVNVLKEAMATGLPSIGTAHGGIPELIRDGENGILVPERDADALAGALRKLLAERATWKELGRAGRAWVAEQFDLRRQSEILESVYCRVAGRGGPPQALVPSP